VSKVLIVLDPTKWPTETFEGRGTYNHIFHDQDQNPPEAALINALQLWSLRRHKVDFMENWWKDLTQFHPSLKGWKMVGHGEYPNTILHPGEKPRKEDRKIGSEEIAAALFGNEN